MSVRWGLMSTASIGSVVLRAVAGSRLTRFTAVASRDGAKARAFAAEHQIVAAVGSYEELLARDDVDAVYVALPISFHTEWTVRALQAGKHVLCEKPFATSAADAEQAVAADCDRPLGGGHDELRRRDARPLRRPARRRRA